MDLSQRDKLHRGRRVAMPLSFDFANMPQTIEGRLPPHLDAGGQKRQTCHAFLNNNNLSYGQENHHQTCEITGRRRSVQHAVRVGDLLFCAGQIPINPADGSLISGNIKAQGDIGKCESDFG